MNVSPAFDKALKKTFSECKSDEPLAHHTTIGVGGPARRFVTANTSGQLMEGIRLCKTFDVPFFILGWGSNLIISDSGFPGLVIQNRAQSWKVVSDQYSVFSNQYSEEAVNSTQPRLAPVGDKYYQADDLEYSEANDPPMLVQIDSGAKIDPLIKTLLQNGVTGLQWFSGIPATVGGAIYMNMHGGYHFFGDLLVKAALIDGGEIKEVECDYFKFDYDWSILHESKETVLWAQLLLRRGDVERARATAREWARRKSLQPQKSAGCVFRNLTAEEQRRLNLPTPSIGYVVDHVLKLKGERRGDAIISPRHAAFVENLGNASATEVKGLIDLMREKAKAELGLDLKLEVEFIGEF
jgi:UDP-N-acetylmuramate dehydrogenase